MKFFLYFFVILIFIGCGYKPSSYYAKNAIEGNVFVTLKIDIDNSKNSVYIKDTVNEMIVNQFQANLTNEKKKANTLVSVQLVSVSHTAISSDDEGYAKTYRTQVNIVVQYNKINEAVKTLTVSDYYDYSIDDDSVINEQNKNDAIRTASKKALSSLFSKIAVYGI